MATARPRLSIVRMHPGWAIPILWLVASTAGVFAYALPVGLVHFLPFVAQAGEPASAVGMTPWLRVIAAILVGAACGSTIGLAQWLVLRVWVRRMGGWVVATIAGYASVGLLILAGDALKPGWLNWATLLVVDGKMHWLARVESSPDYWVNSDWLPGAVTLILFGVVLGIAQWLVLRGRVRGAGWWIAVSGAGWTLAAFLALGPERVLTSWGVPVLVEAIGMAWMLGRQRMAWPDG